MHPKYRHSFEVVSDLPEALKPLKRLAFNFRWTWDPDTQALFREIDKSLWQKVEHNPLELLNKLSPDRKNRLAADSTFIAKLKQCEEALDEYLGGKSWFDDAFPEAVDTTCIAYFCAEFGICESLPIYSGGLGVLAGDHLKAASDLGIPLVGVGLLYSRGYFRQTLSEEGWQQEFYPQYDFYNMPLMLIRGEDDQPVRIEIELPDRKITCQLWKAQVGRVALYLLDSNVLENAPTDQGITDTLYGGDEEMRLRQEMILGIGGMRAIKVLGIQPTVCHMNEGHAAFLTIERLAQFMEANQCDAATARQVVVSGNVFTTHTPVPAGFDMFPPALLRQYIEPSIRRLGLSFEEFIKRGRLDPENEGEAFNMALFAMENANHVNGVSKLHAEVSRGMFQAKWSQYPLEEVPIQPITNGIHTMTWMSGRTVELFDRAFGPSWRHDSSSENTWKQVSSLSDQDLWELRENQRGDFVRFCRARLQASMEKRNAGTSDLQGVSTVLDPRVLTIGFARRFATYKRASLLLSDKERLKALLFHAERPVQFVFAGKSHPRDDGGKTLIQQIVRFIHDTGAQSRMLFLEDYDMEVARAMVQGVDVWLNNPRRPLEASGTSGMKVVPNGGLNCSILDGWWAEGYRPGAGWAIGDTRSYPDETQQDGSDSRALYHLLEQEIAPRFYQRSESGLPTGWIEMMRKSMAELAPVFSTARMVRDYTSRFYVPASRSYLDLSANGLERAKKAMAWRKSLQSAWSDVSIASVSDDAGTVNPLGKTFSVRAKVQLGSLSPSDVRVQVLLGKVGPNRELIDTDVRDLQFRSQEDGLTVFESELSMASTGHRGYVVRVIPSHPDLTIPSELDLVHWEGQ